MAVTLVDVGPRDGLQNETVLLAPGVRADLCNWLAAAGIPRIEAGSFVNPRLVPHMAGAEVVFAALKRRPGVIYAGLVLNERGYERARVAGVRALAAVAGCHFHNTRNTGFTNALAAVEAGATVLDASLGGLGGCPFAPRATGNIATEDLVSLLRGMGYELSIDLQALIACAAWLSDQLGKDLPGQVYKAGAFAPVAQ